MACKDNKITCKLIFNSDRRTQYTSYRFINIPKRNKGLEKQRLGVEKKIVEIMLCQIHSLKA